jgi:hypothetical protein
VAGVGAREHIFLRALSEELKCSVGLLSESDDARVLDSKAKDLMKQNLDGLVGWTLNGGA